MLTSAIFQEPENLIPCWMPKAYTSIDQWWQVDMVIPYITYGILTKGDLLYSSYPESFKLTHSNNGIDWHMFVDHDGNQQVSITFIFVRPHGIYLQF